MPMYARLSVAVAAGPMLLVGLAACSSGGTASGSCAVLLVYNGHSYSGSGGVKRDPQTTGRSMSAVVPRCNDTGDQAQAEQDEPVRVFELADVAPDTALYFNGAVYIRDGRDLPKQTRRWFRPQRCDTAGRFEMTGDWLGVTGPKKVRFDGDIRLPYWLDIHVTSGPSRYVGATITVRATEATSPALTTEDVKRSLWKGGTVTAFVHCADKHFEAVSLHT